MLIAIGSAKGSPGVTTLALALAVVWPDEPALVVEADCGGGDLGARHWLPDSPGLATLATQARTGRVTLAEHVTRLPCGVDVVLAAANRHAATAAVGLLAEADVATWAKERPTILDVGRREDGAPSFELVRAADAYLLVTRGDAASLLRLTQDTFPAGAGGVVVVGGCAFPVEEITDRTSLPVIAQVPWDARAARIVGGVDGVRSGWTRRGMPAVARALAIDLSGQAPRRKAPR